MAHFREAFTKKNAEIDDKKSFSFDFSLDTMDGREDNESMTAKKRNRSKAKKKKKKDSTADATSIDEADDEFADHAAVNTTSTCTRDSDPTNNLVVNELSTNPAFEDVLGSIIASADRENELNDLTKKKKKKKKTKAKTGKSVTSDEDDDIDSLVREINLLTASESTISTPTPSIPISRKIENINSINTPNRKNETNSTFSFKSHKDPELSEEQRALFRFGNGKNLVAIGPPKHKARDSIWRLPPPPGFKIPAEINDTTNTQIKTVPQSHCSPFSFGFGL